VLHTLHMCYIPYHMCCIPMCYLPHMCYIPHMCCTPMCYLPTYLCATYPAHVLPTSHVLHTPYVLHTYVLPTSHVLHTLHMCYIPAFASGPGSCLKKCSAKCSTIRAIFCDSPGSRKAMCVYIGMCVYVYKYMKTSLYM